MQLVGDLRRGQVDRQVAVLWPRPDSCWWPPGSSCTTVLAALHERTEGWAAGPRRAALALAGHREPARFAAEFSGTKRTVADYRLQRRARSEG